MTREQIKQDRQSLGLTQAAMAAKMGIIQRSTEGQRYEMRGEAEIQAFGFEYATAWGYARRKVERHGYQWFFKGEL